MPFRRRRSGWERLPLYWYLVVLFLVGSISLYLVHLITGFTPDRVALSIEALGFDIYWYGIIITAGIGLGGYVVSRLALERARRLLAQEVPAAVRRERVSSLDLPDEIEEILTRHDVETVGDLLLGWGFEQDALGLNQTGREAVRARLEENPALDEAWLQAPRWAQWNPSHVWNGLIWALILGVVGARLYHVLTPSPSMAEVGINSPLDYFRHPLQLVNIRRGGLGIYGGIAGGALGLMIYARRNRIPALAWADLAVVGLALGQFIGRWGNFFNQELYGRPTSVPWAVMIEPAHRLTGYTEQAYFHPAFLYESLWNLLTFVVLLTVTRRYREWLKTGDVMAAYLILYAVGRVLLETVRLDSRTLTLGAVDLGVAVATVVSLVIAAIMGGWLWWRHRPGHG